MATMQAIDPIPSDEPCNVNQAGYIQATLWTQYYQAPFGAEGRMPQLMRQIVQQGPLNCCSRRYCNPTRYSF
jgi:hypothetical protein